MKENVPQRLDHLELEYFHQQMLLLVEGGIPLPQGIRRFALQIRTPQFRQSLSQLAQGLEQGESLSEAMARDQRFFPPEYVALIRAGEQGGSLLGALNLAREHERFQSDFSNRLRTTLLYPFLVLVLVCATYSIAILVSYPVLMDYYQSVGAPLPWFSQVIYGFFLGLGRLSPVWLLLLILLLLLLRRNQTRLWLHRLEFKIPLLRQVLADRFVASFSEGMATLLRAGLPVPESLELMARITSNRSLQIELERAVASTREGAKLEEALSTLKEFPRLYLAAVAAAEESGALPDSLSGMAAMYRSETEYHSRLFLQGLDVFLIVAVGVWVAALMIGLYSLYWRLVLVIDYVLAW